MLLSDDERSYYGSFESMFLSDGWRHLLNEFGAEQKQRPEESFWQATNWDDIVLARVRLSLLLELQNYEAVIEHRKAHLIHEREESYRALLEDQESAAL